MIINKPYIETREDQTYLISKIKDEVSNIEEDIFFAVPNEYGKYLCDEVADSFVVAMLLPALVSKQDIYINAPISEILFYQIENNLIYTLSKVFEKNSIKVIPQSTCSPKYNPTSVATGFSGGIDSFNTFLNHFEHDSLEFRLTDLALFNVGAYGNSKNAQNSFNSDITRTKAFLKDFPLPLITINSNISSLHNYKEIFPFGTRFIINIISGVLAIQKRIKTYIISSGYPIEYISVNSKYRDQANYDVLLAFFLSNSNTKFIISEINKNRVEKTIKIYNNDWVKKHLYVCAADIYNENHNMCFCKDTSPNCSECDKCKRTLITLDLLGGLDDFSNRFDLQKYRKHKDSIFINVLANYKKDHFLKEIHDLMIETNYQIPSKYKIRASLYKLRSRLARVKLIRLIYRFIFRNKLKSKQILIGNPAKPLSR